MSKDPNFTETDLFSFEAGPAKLKKSRSQEGGRRIAQAAQDKEIHPRARTRARGRNSSA